MPKLNFEATLQRVRDNDPTLTQLELYENHIGDEGAKALVHALENNSTLTQLRLCFNRIGNTLYQKITRELHINPRARTLFASKARQLLTTLCLIHQRNDSPLGSMPVELLHHIFSLIDHRGFFAPPPAASSSLFFTDQHTPELENALDEQSAREKAERLFSTKETPLPSDGNDPVHSCTMQG